MATEGDKRTPIHFDRHASDYIHEFENITHELHERCPIAWTDTYGGHWVASGYNEVFEIARAGTLLSNDHDPEGKRKGYKGISIPALSPTQGGFLEMDPPEQRDYRRALDPYLSPAAVDRWKPMVADLARACIDERIETGTIDFVDDLANIVPAIMTLALMGLPLADWVVYCEPAHALIYTLPGSPEQARALEGYAAMGRRLAECVTEIRRHPRPGMVNALIDAEICGAPADDASVIGTLSLLIGGGFDTTTALTGHALEWLQHNPGERDRLRNDISGLLDTATEEFLRFYTPAPGDGRTVTQDYELSGKTLEEGDRLWLSWAMANRDPSVFPDPDVIKLDRTFNRHTSFGLGLHRCIGSNVARAGFKAMITAVLDRLPDFRCDSAGTVHYDTVGVINGMKNLPATFMPGTRRGAGLDETIAHWQRIVDESRLAEPITRDATAIASGN